MFTDTTRELISKIATGSYSDEDLADFLEGVKTMDKGSFMEAYQLLYQEINKYSTEELAPGFKDQLERRLDVLEAGKDFLLGSLVSAAPERAISLFRRKISLFRRKWWRYAAAAILVGVMLLGAYRLFIPQKQIALTQQQRFKNDVAPGKTKAVLTLADGTKITLDSAKFGQLAVQGKTTVTNHNGAITYTGKTTPELLYNTLTTNRGEQSPPLILSDGTKVWLNAASSIRFPVAFTSSTRNVEITGEAYFEVAKDKAKPFYVKVRDIEVEVLGTHFNINAYQDEPSIKTTLLEGSAKIVVGQQTQQGQQDMILLPGQQAQVEGGINLVKEADIDQVMAWKYGLFNFNHADLQTVLRQLARWYDIDVKFEGNGPVRSFHGKITRDLNLSQVIKVLQEVEVKFRIEGKTLIVT